MTLTAESGGLSGSAPFKLGDDSARHIERAAVKKQEPPTAVPTSTPTPEPVDTPAKK